MDCRLDLHKIFSKCFLVRVSMIGGLVLTPSISHALQAPEQADQLATSIADCYVKSFASEPRNKEEVAKPKHKYAKSAIILPKLAEKTKREIVFNQLFT